MNASDVKQYLTRIGIPRDPASLPLSYETLKALQYAHVTVVPYENLDLINGIPLSLDYDDLFDKIVTRRRGGYCFELNGLFGRLLEELGFEVRDYMARFLRGVTGIPMRRHRVKVVILRNDRYVCDVGIGSKAPRWPLLLREGLIQEQFGEIYQWRKEPFYGWTLCDYSDGEWKKIYSFTEEEQADIDYIMPSFYCEAHPDSPFRAEIMASLKTETGRKTIAGMVYRVFTGEEAVETPIGSERELDAILAREFGILSYRKQQQNPQAEV